MVATDEDSLVFAMEAFAGEGCAGRLLWKAERDVVRAEMSPSAGGFAKPCCELSEHALRPFVLDPVMVATSGDPLVEEETQNALRGTLLPLATVVTPNLEEASILTGQPVRTVDDMAAAARLLVGEGADAALVKGGHLEGDAVDLLWDGVEQRIWSRPRIDTRHTHGTGCTLSAAIASHLALGADLLDAVRAAKQFVHRGLASAFAVGEGAVPVDHLGASGRRTS